MIFFLLEGVNEGRAKRLTRSNSSPPRWVRRSRLVKVHSLSQRFWWRDALVSGPHMGRLRCGALISAILTPTRRLTVFGPWAMGWPFRPSWTKSLTSYKLIYSTKKKKFNYSLFRIYFYVFYWNLLRLCWQESSFF